MEKPFTDAHRTIKVSTLKISITWYMVLTNKTVKWNVIHVDFLLTYGYFWVRVESVAKLVSFAADDLNWFLHFGPLFYCAGKK